MTRLNALDLHVYNTAWKRKQYYEQTTFTTEMSAIQILLAACVLVSNFIHRLHYLLKLIY